MQAEHASSAPSAAAMCPGAIITDVLMKRPSVRRDPEKATHALQDLARQMVEKPDTFLPHLVELAMGITAACSAGITLYEPDAPEGDIFRCHYVGGVCAPFAGGIAERNASPCGVCLDKGGPVLLAYPERCFASFAALNLVTPEMMMVPIYMAGQEPLGVLWVMSHDETRCFDSGDAHMLVELARFAGIALKMIRDARALKSALAEQEILTREMRHRISNILTVAGGIVTASARSASSVPELVNSVRGRLEALGRAQDLVHHANALRGVGSTRMNFAQQLQSLLDTVVAPYKGEQNQITIIQPGGKQIDETIIGQNALTALGLILHELATNAVKYGALSRNSGCIDVSWTVEADKCLLIWTESNGPRINSAPRSSGFGSNLIRRTVTGQLGGEVQFDWRPEGLLVKIAISLACLAR